MNCELTHVFLIGAATSGCGKTTITMGLLRALQRKGLRVQPFKCGPDYIDPLFHRQACGVESVNLDTVMASPEHVRQVFERYSQTADVSVIEGVMGLYDGRERCQGSSAEIAMLLDIPVVLVVDARSVAYSVAPLIYGFKHFVPKPQQTSPSGALRIVGVIFNRVGSKRHYSLLRQACDDAEVECLGYVKRNTELQIPSRHLGLSLTEMERMDALINAAADEITEHVNLDRICEYS